TKIASSCLSLNVSPNLQQFFSGQSVSLSCLGQGQEPGWTRRMSKGRQTEQCGAAGSDFGVFNESSCVLDLLSSYTGVYWCETSSGQKSEQINITVTRKEGTSVLILEIPALPVSTGSDITLRCRHKDGSLHAAYFYKNNDIIGNAVKTLSTAIHGAQPSDEGFYSCSTDKSGSSPQSFLRVKGQEAGLPSPWRPPISTKSVVMSLRASPPSTTSEGS
uniref:Immunoglobulin domain-containing protein n=1 Tax=Nothobranchius furzeri TaxID=105023 RepID=A0A8C6KCP5_NOTFU